jgi:transposase
MVWGAIGWN